MPSRLSASSRLRPSSYSSKGPFGSLGFLAVINPDNRFPQAVLDVLGKLINLGIAHHRQSFGRWVDWRALPRGRGVRVL
jgi:hypothetical protein